MKHEKFRFRIKSIYTVLAIIFLSGVFLMLVISYLTISASSREVERVLISDRTAEVNYISHSIGAELSIVRLQNYTVLTENSVNQLALCRNINNEYQTVFYLQQIMSSLRNCMSQHKLIRKMKIFLPETGQLIESENAYTIDSAYLETLHQLIGRYPNGFFRDETDVGFWSTYPYIFSPQNQQSSRISLTILSKSELKKSLEELKNKRTECELIIIFEDELIAATRDLNWSTEKITDHFGISGHQRLHSGTQDYLLIDGSTGISGLTVTMLVPITEALGSLYIVQRLLKIATASWISLFLAACVCLYLIIYRPLHRMGTVMQQVGVGDLNARMPRTWSAEYNQLSDQFNQMTEQLQNMIRREYEYKLLVKEAEMKQLQYQISPHFMYNTYFHLRELINAGDMKNAEQMAGMLGQYMRYIVRVKNGDATLEEEIRHAIIYADIQEMRFSNRLSVQTSVPDGNWQKKKVPCLIVQPLVENAFYHGLKNTLKDGVIRISVEEQEDHVKISVEDNGLDLSEEKLKEIQRSLDQNTPENGAGIALRNIRRRMQTISDKNRLILTRSEMGGMNACLEIYFAD